MLAIALRAAARSPAAKTLASPLARMDASTVRRPNSIALIPKAPPPSDSHACPAHHTTVCAAMTSPERQQRDATGIHGSDPHAAARLHAKHRERLIDDRLPVRTHRCAERRIGIDDHDPRSCLVMPALASLAGIAAATSIAGETSAHHDDHGRARPPMLRALPSAAKMRSRELQRRPDRYRHRTRMRRRDPGSPDAPARCRASAPADHSSASRGCRWLRW